MAPQVIWPEFDIPAPDPTPGLNSKIPDSCMLTFPSLTAAGPGLRGFQFMAFCAPGQES